MGLPFLSRMLTDRKIERKTWGWGSQRIKRKIAIQNQEHPFDNVLPNNGAVLKIAIEDCFVNGGVIFISSAQPAHGNPGS